MADVRQEAFQKLRPACVDLSSVALKFRGKQAPVKSVSHSLERFHAVLEDSTVVPKLNEKLAEYAFFPLTHIFNESQRLSARCLELAVQSLQILVGHGWREKLSPEMGKQLLLLLTLLAGGSPRKGAAEPPTDDLKVAAFACIETVVICLGASQPSKALFDDVGTKNIVDQIVFLLLEAISENESENVQLGASKALLQVDEQVSNRVVLASLLPRTVSTLTKVLRPSTQQRRTYRVLIANLELLRITLQRVLRDDVNLEVTRESDDRIAISAGTKDHDENPEVLDQSWLNATSTQVKIALTHVVQLRRHDRSEVRQAVAQLCLTVLEECSQSLLNCSSVMLETLVSLANDEDMQDLSSTLKYILTSRPILVDDLKSSLQTWMTSLPRLMLANDDRPGQRVLSQISQAIELLSSLGQVFGLIQSSLPNTLIDSVSGVISTQYRPSVISVTEPTSSIAQLLAPSVGNSGIQFRTLVLGQKSPQSSLVELKAMVTSLGSLQQGPSITRAIIDTVPVSDGDQQLSAVWLALGLLTNISTNMIDDFVDVPHSSSDLTTSKPFLISDLYSYTLPLLLQDDQEYLNVDTAWQSQALALECLVLQAGQLGISYRPELMDSLYPVLSFLGSRNGSLQQHAMTTLNLLAKACQYASVTDMLVDNVDYLVNSIALKLNSSNLAPQAPQVLLMMVRLCGARLIPYLDDLIGNIFVALDDFHGYSQLVETLFAVLSAIVDEGAKQPVLAITEGKEAPEHRKKMQKPSDLDDILGDLSQRQSRKRKLEDENDGQITSGPQRPWSDKLDGPEKAQTQSDESTLMEQEDEDEIMPPAQSSDTKDKPLSKSHQLLLSIGQATTPHLSSPSPKVRHTLLNLLDRITPLLARDENSFLPLINSVWPSLKARLFSEVAVDGDGEVAFNVCAAAETIARLCEGAGDFMAGRIEDIFPQLQSLWKRTWRQIETSRARQSRKSPATDAGSNIAAAVDLQITKAPSKEIGAEPASFSHFAMVGRTTSAQILNALITLLIAILTHVRITEDNGDAILNMLAPLIDDPGRDAVRGALETWNADAVWLVRERAVMEREIVEGKREVTDWIWRPMHGLGSRDVGSLDPVQAVIF